MSRSTPTGALPIASREEASAENRRATRDLVDLVSQIKGDGQSHRAVIINISPLGLMCRTDEFFRAGQRVTVWLPILEGYGAEIRWAADGRAGMEFLTPIDPRLYDAMLTLIPPRRTSW